jgi:hypothetical protein
VHEGDAASAGAAARRVVHEAVAGGAAPRQGGLDVRHADADVVDARPAPGQEPGDGPVRIAGFEQLDVHVAESQAHDRGPVGRLLGAGRETEDVAVERDGGGDAGHRDADVGDAGVGVGHDA